MSSRWTAAEDRLLRNLYPQGVPVRVIAERVGRSQDAVTERRRTLGLTARPRSRPWTAAEDRLLVAGAAINLPATALASRLGRPGEQVRRRRRALVGASPASRRYTPADDDAIRAGWTAAQDVEVLALRLQRSPAAVRLRATALGLHAPRPRRRWQPSEDATVRDGYERGLTCARIAQDLPGRTATAIAARAGKLGLATYARAWTPIEGRDLRRLTRGGFQLEQAARALGRTPEALRARSRKLGLEPLLTGTKRPRGRRWTAHEDDLLRLQANLNPATLGLLLDRSPEAITQRLRRLGLRHGAERSPHHPAAVRNGLTPGERVTVTRELRAAGSRRQLAVAQRLGRTLADVRDLAPR